MHQVTRATGEPFPNVEVRKWTEPKRKAVNERLAKLLGAPVRVTVTCDTFKITRKNLQ